MKRSDINHRIREAESLFAAYSVALPPWSKWRRRDFLDNPDVSGFLKARQMGWDVTDFGSGDFSARGLLLFCVRNGIAGDGTTSPYAEKLLISQPGQETPWHFHKEKQEDIIVRAGGAFVVQLANTDDDDRATEAPVTVYTDGRRRDVEAGEEIVLHAGESVSLPRRLAHRFRGAEGDDPVLLAEVSQVNDDFKDNYFLTPLGRFSEIEEDEPPYRLLWNELPV